MDNKIDILYNLVEKMYIDLSNKMDSTKNELAQDIHKLGNVVAKIEQEHGQKLEALLDGYMQNTEQLNRRRSQEA